MRQIMYKKDISVIETGNFTITKHTMLTHLEILSISDNAISIIVRNTETGAELNIKGSTPRIINMPRGMYELVFTGQDYSGNALSRSVKLTAWDMYDEVTLHNPEQIANIPYGKVNIITEDLAISSGATETVTLTEPLYTGDCAFLIKLTASVEVKVRLMYTDLRDEIATTSSDLLQEHTVYSGVATIEIKNNGLIGVGVDLYQLTK